MLIFVSKIALKKTDYVFEGYRFPPSVQVLLNRQKS